MSSKRGAGYEENENEEEIMEIPPAASLTISTVVSTVPATTDQFMYTPEFRRHFIEFVHVQTLMILRSTTKEWKAATEEVIDKGVRSGELIVHGGNDISFVVAEAREERRKLATRVILLLNITKVGDWACYLAVSLVIVDVPECFESIRWASFANCSSLTTIYFPTTLKWIGGFAFDSCTSLEYVDLLHTNLQELGQEAFYGCSELKLMTIPDSLQTLGYGVFHECFKIVPSNIDVREYDDDDEELLDTTSEVVNYLRAKNLPTKEFVGSKYFQTYLRLPYFTGDMLTTMRLVLKAWLAAVNDFIDEAVGKGEMFCQGGGNYNHI
ncbi:hypothetical protein TL16_g07480 [Triparma laevis f. inornata]|uniref:Uncharacterized protein n=1 Tax=Triparma laevis f. inornata TaxID=1714386 RepID=A0A9W7EDV6_9STRA|nr:hypothetical protein TL16_g07480 [Triparma laevis f. inornata]